LWKIGEIQDKFTSTLLGSSDGICLLFLFFYKCPILSFIIEDREEAVGGWKWMWGD